MIQVASPCYGSTVRLLFCQFEMDLLSLYVFLFYVEQENGYEEIQVDCTYIV